ncbi:MAG: helix-turn-helix transcriptional regulator [Afipia sp.]|nr:helix-turn-helix transcriptional regulator [Afipia sp.]
MSKVIFSTDDLPAELHDHARFQSWTELYSDVYCAFNQQRIDDRTFSASFQFEKFGCVKTGQFTGTINGLARTAQHIAKDPNDDFGLSINRGPGLMQCTQIGRELVSAPGMAMFFASSEAIKFDSEDNFNRTSVVVPRRKVLELVANPDDLFVQPLDPNDLALRHLSRYLDALHDLNCTSDDAALAGHIETTLLDLVALVLGARRDMAEVASVRGLRSARLQGILAAIKKNFADPAFSSERVACAAGVSRRYVNDLLHETGSSFAERVLELRLQKARSMLASACHDTTKINDIAFACGFNEVSYFHRCFRRRFGAAPNEFRGARRQDE